MRFEIISQNKIRVDIEGGKLANRSEIGGCLIKSIGERNARSLSIIARLHLESSTTRVARWWV